MPAGARSAGRHGAGAGGDAWLNMKMSNGRASGCLFHGGRTWHHGVFEFHQWPDTTASSTPSIATWCSLPGVRPGSHYKGKTALPQDMVDDF